MGMKNILLEMAAEAELPITVPARISFFEAVADAIEKDGKARLGELPKEIMNMDSRDVVGAKNALVRLSKLGFIEIVSNFMNADGEIVRSEAGAMRLVDLPADVKEQVVAVDWDITYSASTKERLRQMSGRDLPYVVQDPYARPLIKNEETVSNELPADTVSDNESGSNHIDPGESAIPSMSSLGGETPRSDMIESFSATGGINAKQKMPETKQVLQPSPVLKVKSGFKFRKVTAYAVGLLVAVGGITYALLRSEKIQNQYDNIETQIKSPADGLRVVKIADMEKLYAEIETLKAERETIMRKAEIKVEEARAKLMEEMSEKRSRIESDAYDRGRTDASQDDILSRQHGHTFF